MDLNLTPESQAKRYRLLKIIAQACLLLATAGIAFASYYWFNPRSFAFSSLDARTGQILVYGGIPLLIGLFALAAPAPAGILGLLYCLSEIPRYSISPIPPTPLIPAGVYLPLYGIFIAGCAAQIALGIRETRALPPVTSSTDKRIRLAGRLSIVVAVVTTFIVFPFFPIGTAPFFIGLGVIVFAISWFWPGAGGTLVVLVFMEALSALVSSNYGEAAKVIYSVILMLYLCGGLLNIVAAARARWPGSVWRTGLVLILVMSSVGGVTFETYARENA